MAVPPRDERRALVVALLGGVADRRGHVAVHEHLAGDEPHRVRVRRLEDRVHRRPVRRGEHHRGGRAVAQQLLHEEFGDLARVAGVPEPAFGGKRVALEPFEELRAVRRDDVGLRVMDVRVDEPRQDQLSPVVDDARIGRQRGKDRRRLAQRGDAAVAHDEHAVGEVAVRGVAEYRRIAGEVEDLAPERGDLRGRGRIRDGHRRSPGRGQRFAPCANHAATRARSSSVICVRLPIGM